MMSSATSTDVGSSGRTTGFRARHLYLLLAMAGATGAVVVSDHTHPAALLLLSAAVLAAGLVGATLHEALLGFFGVSEPRPAGLKPSDRDAIEAEKALVLRSIKELEFDHAMRKISTADFEEMRDRLKVRAAGLIQQLDVSGYRAVIERDLSVRRTAQATVAPAAAGREPACASCETTNDADARFCKQCGAPLPEPA
jgi:hypothetical protein